MKINELAKISGVSTRTLRYYDEIGLLSPAGKNDAGYRIYTTKEIDLLQQILFYRALGLKLDNIKEIIYAPNFELVGALKEHREQLLSKRTMLEELLVTVEKTIYAIEEETYMSNEEKFKGFKEELIRDNEAKYGEEIREHYGEESVKASYGKIRSLTEQQYEALQQLERQMFERLREAMELGNAASETAYEVAEMHKRWLSFYWAKYTKEAHAGIAEMYIADERFTTYYDERVQKGATQFLHDCIVNYTKK
ncbi:MerR family transcriptional regulator [Solibacillus sp. CAU 1738]|uniref:MerR family transcriptional regulator n=1 Tax=Solibacillus sp. CAU 1738 TaxID=3140363 RepID=UPI003261BA17